MVSPLVFTSCQEDEVPGSPTLTLSRTTTNVTVGQMASTTLTISAPAGAKSLIITRNGVPQTPVSLNGVQTATHNFEYNISDQTAPGAVVTFAFSVIDNLDRISVPTLFTVTAVAKPIIEVTGSITGNVTWTAANIYRLNGFVRVVDGARLTIEPGTLIIGDRATKGTLIVQMGGQIFANGTSTKPIVMTSENAPGLREPGDWGGLVICGRAPNNITSVTGLPVELEGGYGALHGGNLPADNSGVLRFVRIEYAGIPINPNEEVNSLTLGSVGSGTVIENIMVSFGLDDAFEWFGGTVNARNLISYRTVDDCFDVDMGWTGNVQFAVSIRAATMADQSTSNTFEVDNNGTGSAALPFTEGVFSNVTVIGPKKNRDIPISLQYGNAAHLRRNSRISIYNSFMTAFPNGLFIDDDRPGSGQAALDGHLQIRNLWLAGVSHWGGNGYGSIGTVFTGAPANGAQHPTAPRGVALRHHANFPGGTAAYEAWFNTADFNNRLFNNWELLLINETIFDLGQPVLTPLANSPLLTGARWNNTPKAGTFFERVPFVGAFGTTDWTQGWAEWNPHLVKYF
ncbi:MAG TPA: hypothetical protein VLH37_02055 [Bacteroidales bacterium]|nr:hypothetical protein [Bacteroidales bacterium]